MQCNQIICSSVLKMKRLIVKRIIVLLQNTQNYGQYFDQLYILILGEDRAMRAVQSFLLQGKSVYFVSNNGSKSREEYLEKLVKLGFEAHKVHCIFLASFPGLPRLLHDVWSRKAWGATCISRDSRAATASASLTRPCVLTLTLERRGASYSRRGRTCIAMETGS